jgi:hypothetical protein
MYFLLNFRFAWYQQAGRVVKTESTLTLAENINVVLPTAQKGCHSGGRQTAKMTSLGGKLTALARHPTKRENKA